MKGLKKIALVSAIAAAPFAANAELTAMDDSAMSAATGQAGLTIDLTANVNIGEVAYQDAGFIAISDIKFGGAGLTFAGNAAAAAADPLLNDVSTVFDNVTMKIDVAGSTPDTYEFGLEAQLAQTLADSGSADLGELMNKTTSATQKLLVGGYAQWVGAGQQADVTSLDQLLPGGIEDGDLVIHLGTTDSWDETKEVVVGADFGLTIGSIALQKEADAANIGSFAGTATTTLVSGINLFGKIGPVDIIIDESTSNVAVSAYFNVAGGLSEAAAGVGGGQTHTAMKFDFLNVEIGAFKMANMRGANAAATAGYAHAAAVIGTKKTDGTDAKGLFIDVKDFSADMDIVDIYVGTGVPGTKTSIGSLYVTDLAVTATMDVYGH